MEQALSNLSSSHFPNIRLDGIPRKINREFHGKQCHLVRGCKLWSNPYKNAMILNHCHFFKDLAMKLEVKYLFPTSSLDTTFFYFSVAWRSGNAKNISTEYYDVTNRNTRELNFWIIIEQCGSKVQHPPIEISNGDGEVSPLTPEIVYWKIHLYCTLYSKFWSYFCSYKKLEVTNTNSSFISSCIKYISF